MSKHVVGVFEQKKIVHPQSILSLRDEMLVNIIINQRIKHRTKVLIIWAYNQHLCFHIHVYSKCQFSYDLAQIITIIYILIVAALKKKVNQKSL